MKCHILVLLLIASAITGAMPAFAQPFLPNDRTLLLDHFDEPFVPDGVQCTRPVVITALADLAGGRPGKGGTFVPGKFGNALQFHKLMKMDYPAPGNIDLGAGLAEFWVSLNFNAEEVIKNPGKLSNQLFLTVWGPESSMVCVYSTLLQTNIAVWDKQRQLVCYAGFPSCWKAGEWHHLELRWGRSLELWCDGKREAAQDWQGLFGPIDVKTQDLRLTLGSHVGFNDVESEFAIDELRILGPGDGQSADHPLMTLPRIKAPTIDGKMEPGEWDGAAQTTGFVGLNDNSLVEEQTVVSAGWDAEALYLCIECLNPGNRALAARLTGRDTPVYGEDAFELFLQPQPGQQPVYQLAANAIGTQYDSRVDAGVPVRNDVSFNPNWTVRAACESGRWVAECCIPFKELDGRAAPKEGEHWRVNFCRDTGTLSGGSAWSHAAGSFQQVDHFGEIVFSESDRAIRLGTLGDWHGGKLSAELSLTGLLFDPLVTVKAKLAGEDAKAIVETENRLADYRTVAIKPPTLVTGFYNLNMHAGTANGDMYSQRLPLRVEKAYDISVEGYPREGKLWVTANVAGLSGAPKGLVARSRVMQGDKEFGQCETAEFTRGIGTASVDLALLPPGAYIVKSEAVIPDGSVLAKAEAEFEQFAKPAWWDGQAGVDHSVPWPWEPVRASDADIGVWGRQYDFGGASLPRQIVNQGEEMLAGPVTLKLTTGETTSDLAAFAARNTASQEDAAGRQAEGRVGNLSAKLVTVTEFDGLMRCDLTLSPESPTDVSSLLLEVPIKSKYAAFLLPSTGIAANALAMDGTPWHGAFTPQVWTGNDDIGLAWFAESDEGWWPRDDHMLEVVPEGDRTIIRCGMIRTEGTARPLKLDKPMTITFGLMATPVKDAHAGDPFWCRFGDPVDQPPPMEFLQYPDSVGIDPGRGTLEFWLAPALDTEETWREVASLNDKNGSFALSVKYGAKPAISLSVTNGARQESITADIPPGALNEYVHVALSWNKKLTLFVAGKLLGTVNLALPPTFEKPALRFGCASEWQGSTRIAVDEIRLSNAVRYDADVYDPPTAPFVGDAQTLLLDHLDERFRPDGEDAETHADVLVGASGALGGVPSLGCRFVNGKFGAGLQIANGPSLDPQQTVKNYGFDAATLWNWADADGSITGWPPPLLKEPLVADLRQRVKTYNGLGLRCSPYMGYPALGAPSQLSAQFGNEWGRKPLSTQPWEPPKGHYFWDACARSGFADYMAEGTRWVLDDLGFYACYTDGLAQVYPCQNTHHGCGYRDEQGTLHSTWPLFATRDMLKRMYKQIHARHQDGYLINHVSFNIIIPTMSFTDVYYTGEHEQYEDLTKFRVRWQGKQWGIWPSLLGDDCHCYKPVYMTYGLLHGVSVMPEGFLGRNDMARKTVNIWQAYDAFGYRDAEWIPYYRAESGPVMADNPNVKVSLYLHRGKSALLVVGNLSHEVVECGVRVDRAAMALKELSAVNALEGRSISMQDGVLSVRLRPASFILVRIE